MIEPGDAASRYIVITYDGQKVEKTYVFEPTATIADIFELVNWAPRGTQFYNYSVTLHEDSSNEPKLFEGTSDDKLIDGKNR